MSGLEELRLERGRGFLYPYRLRVRFGLRRKLVGGVCIDGDAVVRLLCFCSRTGGTAQTEETAG